MAVAVIRSDAARARSDLTEWAEGLSFTPASHIGYHSGSAIDRTSFSVARGGWSRITSMSLPGQSSPLA